MSSPLSVSVIIPVTDRPGDPARVVEAMAEELRRLGRTGEILVVVTSRHRALLDELRGFRDARGTAEPPVRLLEIGERCGESAALVAGFERARMDLVVTQNAYFQVQPGDLGKALAALEDSAADVVVARRHPDNRGRLNRFQSRLFHRVVQWLTHTEFRDITNGFRVIRREVAHRLELYGELHRFIPVLAHNLGFDVLEVPLRQHEDDVPRRLYPFSAYPRRLLDLLTIFFLSRFTQKPLRFFGFIGLGTGGVGFAICAYLTLSKLAGSGISDRPLLLLGVLLLVLGVQSIALGLLGEIVIFTHSRRFREYHVVEIVHHPRPEPAPGPEDALGDTP